MLWQRGWNRFDEAANVGTEVVHMIKTVIFDLFEEIVRKRKDGFLQAESPMNIVLKAKKEHLL